MNNLWFQNRVQFKLFIHEYRIFLQSMCKIIRHVIRHSIGIGYLNSNPNYIQSMSKASIMQGTES